MSSGMNKYSHYDYQPSLETCIEGSFESEDHTTTGHHESDMDEKSLPLQPKRFFPWGNIFCDPFRGDSSSSSSNINSQAFRSVAPSSFSTTNAVFYHAVPMPQDTASTTNITELYSSSSSYSSASVVVPSTTTELIIMEREDQLQLTTASANTDSNSTQVIQRNSINTSNANVTLTQELAAVSSSSTTTTLGNVTDSSSNSHIVSTPGDRMTATIEQDITVHSSSTENRTAFHTLPPPPPVAVAVPAAATSDSTHSCYTETKQKRVQLFIASSASQILFFLCLVFMVVCYYYYYVYHHLLHHKQKRDLLVQTPAMMWWKQENNNIQIISQQQQVPDNPIVENSLEEIKVKEESTTIGVNNEDTLPQVDVQFYSNYSTNFLQQQQQQHLTTNENDRRAITPSYLDSSDSATSLETDALQQLNEDNEESLYPALHADTVIPDLFIEVVTTPSIQDGETGLDKDETTHEDSSINEDGKFLDECPFHDQSGTHHESFLVTEHEMLEIMGENDGVMKKLHVAISADVDSEQDTTLLTYDTSEGINGEEAISDLSDEEKQKTNQNSTIHDDGNVKYSQEFSINPVSDLDMPVPSDGVDILVSHVSSSKNEIVMENFDSKGLFTFHQNNLIETSLSEEKPSINHAVGNTIDYLHDSFVSQETVETEIIYDAETSEDTRQHHISSSSCVYGSCYASTENDNEFLLATIDEEYTEPIEEDYDTIEAITPFSKRASSFFVPHKRPEVVQLTIEERLYQDMLEEVEDDGETTYLVLSSFVTGVAIKGKLLIQKLSLVRWTKQRFIILAALKKIPPFFHSKVREIVRRIHYDFQVLKSKDKLEVLHDLAEGIRYETKQILNKIEPLQRQLQQRVSNVDVKKLPMRAFTTIKMHIKELNEREDSYDD